MNTLVPPVFFCCTLCSFLSEAHCILRFDVRYLAFSFTSTWYALFLYSALFAKLAVCTWCTFARVRSQCHSCTLWYFAFCTLPFAFCFLHFALCTICNLGRLARYTLRLAVHTRTRRRLSRLARCALPFDGREGVRTGAGGGERGLEGRGRGGLWIIQ